MAFIKKYWWIILIVAAVILYFGYLGRHRIKAFLGFSTPTQQTATTPTSTESPAVPTNNIYTTRTDKNGKSYLADFNGMSLYIFDKDTNGVSNCDAECPTLWPVYTSGATAQGTFPTNISVITRGDGTKQFAWKGMPLYYHFSDKNPGDTTGDGLGGVWHLATP